jgi:hypothetical protein
MRIRVFLLDYNEFKCHQLFCFSSLSLTKTDAYTTCDEGREQASSLERPQQGTGRGVALYI